MKRVVFCIESVWVMIAAFGICLVFCIVWRSDCVGASKAFLA